ALTGRAVLWALIVEGAELTSTPAGGERHAAGDGDRMRCEEFLDAIQGGFIRELAVAIDLQVHLVEAQLAGDARVLLFERTWIGELAGRADGDVDRRPEVPIGAVCRGCGEDARRGQYP